MNSVFPLILVFMTGGLLGLFFFAGLWLTLQYSLHAKYAAIWLILSFLLRSSMVLWAIYWLGQGQWQRFSACMLGFVLMRFVLLNRLAMASANGRGKIQETHLAP